MKDTFYIVKDKDNWYRLHMTSTHYCLGACETLPPLLKTVERLTAKYKTGKSLLKGLSHLEDKGHVNEKTAAVYARDYITHGNEYKDLIDDVVEKTLAKHKMDTPYFRNLKRIGRKSTTLIAQDTPKKTDKVTEDLKRTTPSIRRLRPSR